VKKYLIILSSCLSILLTPKLEAQNGVSESVRTWSAEVSESVLKWRRHIHQYPELSNREFKTAELVADHLKSLGIEVQTEVAHTGVVGILDSGKPGPVIGLRADMDALPVTERVDLPFASKVRSEYNGIETGVMHACGHDAHTAILMGVAEVLAKHKDKLNGKVKFVFQPAEETPPPGEEGGAELMVKEGVMKNPDIEVMFGLHLSADTYVGEFEYRPGPIMAAADRFVIKVRGVQSHGSTPWKGVDPIVVSSQIINGLQSIISRQTELTKEGAVITVGLIRGGIRNNIIPEEVEMIGTIRTLDTAMQNKIHKKIHLTATKIAESAGAIADVSIEKQYPVTINNDALTAWASKTLEYNFGRDKVKLVNPITGAEDFSFYANEVPGFFFFIGGCPLDGDPLTAPAHHTPDFYIDEGCLEYGVKSMLNLTLSYMHDQPALSLGR
jgi:amidohydrolase